MSTFPDRLYIGTTVLSRAASNMATTPMKECDLTANDIYAMRYIAGCILNNSDNIANNTAHCHIQNGCLYIADTNDETIVRNGITINGIIINENHLILIHAFNANSNMFYTVEIM